MTRTFASAEFTTNLSGKSNVEAYDSIMISRMQRMGRPTRGELALIVFGVALFLFAVFVLSGSPAGHHTVGHGQNRYRVTTPAANHWDDYLIFGLRVIGPVIALYGVYRWGTRGERERPNDVKPEEARRHFGDSIVDVRTGQDPAVGMLPVDTTRGRR